MDCQNSLLFQYIVPYFKNYGCGVLTILKLFTTLWVKRSKLFHKFAMTVVPIKLIEKRTNDLFG